MRARRHAAVVVLAMAASMTLAGTAGAGTFLGSGADGTAGASGTSGNGTAGDPILHAENSPTDAVNSVTVNGGQGGAGGTSASPATTPGGNGGAGGNATANASSTYATTGSVQSDATAFGGNGGNAPDRGTSGNGGSASASTSVITSAAQNIEATSLATGGDGGNAPAGTPAGAGQGGSATAAGTATLANSTLQLAVTAGGGAGGSVLAGTGNGGAGGSATAQGSATSTTDDRGFSYPYPELSVSVAVQGGTGGQGSGAGFHGGNGGAIVFSPVSAVNNGTGDAQAALQATGGSGGDGINGATPGQGVVVSLTDQVSGSAPGSTAAGATLTLTQVANGGAGGSADSGTGAAGASAYSKLTRHNDGGSLLQTTISATGGIGGNGIGTGSANGGNGGAATAIADLVNADAAFANVTSVGGAGGSATSASGNGGNGGTATLSASTVSAGGPPSVYAEADGGNGGDGSGTGRRGGDGGVATLTTAHAGSGSLFFDVDAEAHQTGGNGGNGSNGAGGGNGAASTMTDAVSGSPAPGATDVSATLTQEARGGRGGNAADGGTAGLGGAATSNLTANQSVGGLSVQVRATGGGGGSISDGPANSSAANGATGSGSAHLTAPEQVYANVDVGGGDGGDAGVTTGGRAGAGASALLLPSSATSTGSSVRLYGAATGGNGGYGSLGAAGGKGADVTITDALDGNSPESVDLNQSAYGGGGGSSDTGAAGQAGNASSHLTRSKSNTASLVVSSGAFGGYGGSGNGVGIAAAPGGTGDALAAATNSAGAADAEATAYGGFGGQGLVGASGGRGGTATSIATAQSTSNLHDVTASAQASGGNGGSASYIPASGAATAGAGGDATATASGTAWTGPLSVNASAAGGYGGTGEGAAQTFGAGGNATATATGSGLANVSINAVAIGGYANGGALPGTAVAHASGSGATGSLSALATSNVYSLQLTALATSPAAGSNAVDARTSIGQAVAGVTAPPPGQQSLAYLEGLPVAADRTTSLANTPNAQTLIGDGSTGTNVVALAALGTGYATGATGPQTYTSDVSLSVDTAGYAPGRNIYLSLLTPTASPAAQFSAIKIDVFREGATTPTATYTFPSATAAANFFRDHTLDLGPASGPTVSGSLDLDIRLTATSATPGSNFTATLALASLQSVNQWVGPDGESISSDANWSTGTVPSSGAALNFLNTISTNTHVQIPGTVTFSTINFGSNSKYTLTGAGSLQTTSDPAGHRAIQVTTNSANTIDVNLALHGNTEIVGGAVTFTRGIAWDPGVDLTVRASSVSFQCPATAVGTGASLTIEEGASAQATSTSPFSAGGTNLTLHNDGTLTLSSSAETKVASLDGTGSTHLSTNSSLTADRVLQGSASLDAGSTLTVRPNGTPAATSRLAALVLSEGAGGAGTVNLNDNDLIVDYGTGNPSPAPTLLAAVQRARHGGDWQGPAFDGATYHARITSSAAAGEPHQLTTLAVVDNADYGFSTFDGIAIDPSAVLIKYTYYGDINLDGKVDADDYALLDRSVAMHLPASWLHGDFNGSGTVDAADYLLIDKSFTLQSGTPLSPSFLAERASQFGEAYVTELLASVPEPSTGIWIAAMLPLTRRRRPRR